MSLTIRVVKRNNAGDGNEELDPEPCLEDTPHPSGGGVLQALWLCLLLLMARAPMRQRA